MFAADNRLIKRPYFEHGAERRNQLDKALAQRFGRRAAAFLTPILPIMDFKLLPIEGPKILMMASVKLPLNYYRLASVGLSEWF